MSLAICASAFAAPDQPDDQRGKTGTGLGAEAETAAGPDKAAKTHAPGERPWTASAQDAVHADSGRAPFSGRGLTLQQKRIFVLGLETQEKK